MMQRLHLARGLVSEPEVMFLDEAEDLCHRVSVIDVGAEVPVGAGRLAASWLSYRRFSRRARATGSLDVG